MGPGQHFGLHRDLGHEEGIGIGPLSPLTSRVGRRGSFGALAAVQRSPGGLAASAPMAGHASLASQPLRRRLQRGTRRHLGPTDEGRAARVHIVRGRRGRLGGAWAGTSEGTSRFSVIPTTLRQQRPSDHKPPSSSRRSGSTGMIRRLQTSRPLCPLCCLRRRMGLWLRPPPPPCPGPRPPTVSRYPRRSSRHRGTLPSTRLMSRRVCQGGGTWSQSRIAASLSISAGAGD